MNRWLHDGNRQEARQCVRSDLRGESIVVSVGGAAHLRR